jgi:hypothetical protein
MDAAVTKEERSRSARATAIRYLMAAAMLNLAWEFAQLPLYTLWSDESARRIVLNVLHCSAGDVMIATAALVLAVIILGRGRWPAERVLAVGLATIALGLAYTAFSEWLNVYVRRSWAYSPLMPLLHLAGISIGLSPLLQWVFVPTIAFALAFRRKA